VASMIVWVLILYVFLVFLVNAYQAPELENPCRDPQKDGVPYKPPHH